MSKLHPRYIEINKFSLRSPQGVTRLINNIYFHLTNPDYTATEINLVFSTKSQFFPPFSMLFLALSIKQMHDEFEIPITFSNYQQDWLGYACHMGFFQLAGFDYGKKVGEAKGGENYLPLIASSVPDINIDIDALHAAEVERMQDIGDDLAKRLLKTNEGEAFKTLSYLCREILRNVVEHSYSDMMYYSAQYFPKGKFVEVVVADEGEGVREGLNQNPKLYLTDDRDAVKFAVLPGMSGRSHKYSSKRSSNHIYANSGYGLFLTQKICSNAGSQRKTTGVLAKSLFQWNNYQVNHRYR